MISNTDFEKLWFMYQTDGASKGITINTFCQQNGVSYVEFEKWYKKTHRVVERLEIIGGPDEEEETSPTPAVAPQPKQNTLTPGKGGILVTIKTRDGLQIQKGGLDYNGLKLLVERLEGLC